MSIYCMSVLFNELFEREKNEYFYSAIKHFFDNCWIHFFLLNSSLNKTNYNPANNPTDSTRVCLHVRLEIRFIYFFLLLKIDPFEDCTFASFGATCWHQTCRLLGFCKPRFPSPRDCLTMQLCSVRRRQMVWRLC